jgi:transcriptional regulator with XRE-family HTH domain
MPADTDLTLDWPALVREARRRRKELGLTLEKFARAAGVSKATLITFERGDVTIGLDRALRIVDAAGLLAKKRNDHPDIVQNAREFLDELVASYPAGHPIQMPRGRWYASFELTSRRLIKTSRDRLEQALHSAPAFTRQPIFRLPQYGTVSVGNENAFTSHNNGENNSPAWLWRVQADGQGVVISAYDEDQGSGAHRPGKTLNVAQPVWRLGEVVCQARHIAKNILDKPTGEDSVILYSAWTDLHGRQLVDAGELAGEPPILRVSAWEATHRFPLQLELPDQVYAETLAGELETMLADFFVSANWKLPRQRILSEIRDLLDPQRIAELAAF